MDEIPALLMSTSSVTPSLLSLLRRVLMDASLVVSSASTRAPSAASFGARSGERQVAITVAPCSTAGVGVRVMVCRVVACCAAVC